MRSRLFGLAVGVALFMTSLVSWGSASYPVLIQQHLGLACPKEPVCTICHDGLNGGLMTVHKPFGRTMIGLGLIAESPASLQRALDKDKAQHIDSDGDGDTDIDALIACKDPNVANASTAADPGGDGAPAPPSSASAASTDPIPEYGCAIGSAPAGNGVWAAISVGAALVLGRRRKRGSPGREGHQGRQVMVSWRCR